MPWLSLEEFHLLCSYPVEEWRDLQDLTATSKTFFESNLSNSLVEAQRVIDQCAREEIKILYPGHANYPRGYFELEDPPLFLSLEGEWSGLPAIGIVGSREPSRFAVDWLNENIAQLYERQDFVIVSGGARGIDLTAHLCAMRKSKPTIVLLPSGLRNVYPPDLRKWKLEILETGGGFVSELPLNLEMRKHHFIKRNRLIVGASDLVFVAEARRKSGSMITAKIAQGMNRNLCTLPASPAMTCAQGSLDLIFEGTHPIRDYEDLAALLDVSSKRVLVKQPLQWRISHSQSTFPLSEEEFRS